MATPKIDRIAIEFMQRIGGTFDSAFTAGGGAMPGSDLIPDADTIMAFINKSMFKLFNDVWLSVEGDAKAFIRIFPELHKQKNSMVFTSGVYTIADPHKDIFKLIDGYVSTSLNYVKVWSSNVYSIAKSGYNSQYVGTDTKPAMIYMTEQQKIYLFSDSDLTVFPSYIKFPLNQTDGSFLTQNGSYDSPFYDQWNSRIAEIAEGMYLKAVSKTG